jgi:hypothetical protein
MNPIEEMKFKVLTPPQLKDDGDFADNTYIDTAGWNHLRVLFIVGDLDADVGSTAETAEPFVEECDTSGGTYTAVDDAELSDVIADDDDNKMFAIDIDLTKSHKRFMQVNAPHAGDGSNGANMCILGILSKKRSGTIVDGSEFEELIQV